METNFLTHRQAKAKGITSLPDDDKFCRKQELIASEQVNNSLLSGYQENQYVRHDDIVIPVKPKLFFKLDFLDRANNTEYKVKDLAYGFELTKTSAGSVQFLDNYQGFKRVLRTNTSSESNVYKIDWSNISHVWNRFPNEAFTVVSLQNCIEVFSISERGGTLAIWNSSQILGWHSDTSMWTVAQITTHLNSYAEYPNDSDIGMIVLAFDKAKNLRKVTQRGPGFSLLTDNNPFEFDSTGSSKTSLEFLKSQEASYYFQAGGMIAGYAIYEGILTDEQLKWMYDNKTLL